MLDSARPSAAVHSCREHAARVQRKDERRATEARAAASCKKGAQSDLSRRENHPALALERPADDGRACGTPRVGVVAAERDSIIFARRPPPPADLARTFFPPRVAEMFETILLQPL